jgi:hypothetical protein
MIHVVERAAHGRDIAGDAGGGLVVADQHRLDAPRLVTFERAGEGLDRRALAPGDIDRLDLDAVALAEIDPEMRELAIARRQHLVARRQRVGDRGLPAPGARRREQEHLAVDGLEYLPQVAKERQREGRYVRRPLVLAGDRERLANALRHIRRAGNEQEIASGHRPSSRAGERSAALAGCSSPRILGASKRRQDELLRYTSKLPATIYRNIATGCRILVFCHTKRCEIGMLRCFFRPRRSLPVPPHRS